MTARVESGRAVERSTVVGGSVEQPGELLTGLGGLVGRLLTTRSDMPQRRSRCHAYSVGYAADRHPMLINR